MYTVYEVLFDREGKEDEARDCCDSFGYKDKAMAIEHAKLHLAGSYPRKRGWKYEVWDDEELKNNGKPLWEDSREPEEPDYEDET